MSFSSSIIIAVIFMAPFKIIFPLLEERFNTTFVRWSKIDFVRMLFRKFGDYIQCNFPSLLSAEPAHSGLWLVGQIKRQYPINKLFIKVIVITNHREDD